MIVESLCCIDKIQRTSHIHALHILSCLYVIAFCIQTSVVGKNDVAVCKIHYRGHSEGQIVGKAHLAKHTDMETAIPCVLVTGNKRFCLIAVGICVGYRSYVLKFKILEMRSYNNSEVHWAQVAIRAVLNRPFLCNSHQWKEY